MSSRPTSRPTSLTSSLHWILRIAVFMCFVGHGAFGIMTKAAWLPYYGVLAVPENLAWRTMPIVGTMDIMIGILALLSPFRGLLLYGAAWCLFTALLRPLAGQGIWETLERAGNYGVPLAFLAMAGWGRSWRGWFEPIGPRELTALDAARLARVSTILRLTTGLLLIGHGGFGALMQKDMLTQMYASVGLDSLPFGAAGLTPAIGWFELLLGVAVIAAPIPALLLFIVGWKLATEMLYPLSGYPFWEFVERGGSYGAPLALYFIVTRRAAAPAVEPARGSALAALLLLASLGCASTAGATANAPAANPPAAPSVADSVAAAHIADSLATLPDSLRAKGAKVFPRPDSLLAPELRKGGYVLVFRHAQTDWGQRDAEIQNFADRSAQRNLSAAGDSTSVAIGKAIRKLEIPIGRVLSSPMWRCRDTADLAFERCDTTNVLFRRSKTDRAARIALLSTPITDGKNLVLVTHQDVLLPIIKGLRREQLKEADAFVVKPLGDGKFEIIAQVTPADWERFAGAAPK